MQEIIFSRQNSFEEIKVCDSIFKKIVNFNTVSKKHKLRVSIRLGEQTLANTYNKLSIKKNLCTVHFGGVTDFSKT